MTFTNIKYGNTATTRAIPSYIVNLRIAARVLNGCAAHGNCADTRKAARFTIAEARAYIDKAEKRLDALVEEGDIA